MLRITLNHNLPYSACSPGFPQLKVSDSSEMPLFHTCEKRVSLCDLFSSSKPPISLKAGHQSTPFSLSFFKKTPKESARPVRPSASFSKPNYLAEAGCEGNPRGKLGSTALTAHDKSPWPGMCDHHTLQLFAQWIILTCSFASADTPLYLQWILLSSSSSACSKRL